MSTRWVPVPLAIAASPAIAELSPAARCAWLALRLAHAQYGAGGTVPGTYGSARGLPLAAAALLVGVDADAALAEMTTAGLIESGPDGVRLTDYDVRAEAAPCSRCGVRNPDPRTKTCEKCRSRMQDARRGAGAAQEACAQDAGSVQEACRPRAEDVGRDTRLPNPTQPNPTPPNPTPPPGAGASAAQGPEPEPEPETGGGGDPPGERDPVVALQDALMRSAYRSNLPSWPRRMACATASTDLAPTGITPDDVDQLDRLDQAKAKDRGALLATWLDGNTWREVIDEQGMKQKQRGNLQRGRQARATADGDELDGVYGGGDPKPTASVIDDVLQRARKA